MLLDILTDALIDTIKLIPFLFITYLIMEYLEHKTANKTQEHIKKSGKLGPIIGGLLGAVPQCGFSVSATNLYVGRVISLGTLMAVYLSTSDEMIPVFLSESVSAYVILKVLGIKVLVGIIAGIIIDFIFRKTENVANDISHMCEHDHCNCENGVFKSSLKHTMNITIFIFVINIVFGTIISIVGEDTISSLVLNRPVLGPVIAGIVGLIPNCAASVIIAELYVDHLISAGAMISGLLVGAGVGLLVLFKENDNIKENLKIVSILYFVGVIFGILFETFGLVL